MNSIESFKHLSNVGESGARWLAGRRVAAVAKKEPVSYMRGLEDRERAVARGKR